MSLLYIIRDIISEARALERAMDRKFPEIHY